MSYQTSKTAGALWASLVYITDEHEKIEGFSMFASLILAEAEAKKAEMRKTDEGYAQICKDVESLRKIANIDEISLGRDMSISAVRYAYIMTAIQQKQREILPICLRQKLLEFSDGARFAGYGEGL